MSAKKEDSNLIAIYSGDPIHAEIVKNRLLNEGILAHLKNQHMGTIAPWQVSAGGFAPIEVLIFERDKERTLLLIKEFRNIK